jgi:hypothetical protein
VIIQQDATKYERSFVSALKNPHRKIENKICHLVTVQANKCGLSILTIRKQKMMFLSLSKCNMERVNIYEPPNMRCYVCMSTNITTASSGMWLRRWKPYYPPKNVNHLPDRTTSHHRRLCLITEEITKDQLWYYFNYFVPFYIQL